MGGVDEWTPVHFKIALCRWSVGRHARKTKMTSKKASKESGTSRGGINVAHLLPPRNMCITFKKFRRDVICFLTGPDLFLVPFLFLGDFVPHVLFISPSPLY